MGEFGKLNFSVSFNRTSAFPIEANGYFESLEAAQAAAATAVEVGSAESTYYIGLTLTVVEGDTSTSYIILPDKSLKKVGGEEIKYSNGNPMLLVNKDDVGLIKNASGQALVGISTKVNEKGSDYVTLGWTNGAQVLIEPSNVRIRNNGKDSITTTSQHRNIHYYSETAKTGNPAIRVSPTVLELRTPGGKNGITLSDSYLFLNKPNTTNSVLVSNKNANSIEIGNLEDTVNIISKDGKLTVLKKRVLLEGEAVGAVCKSSDGTGEIFNSYEGELINVASGQYSHAEGYYTKATGDMSHAEGNLTNASGRYSHAEGLHTDAIGYEAHAEGSLSRANGDESHAEGSLTYANGQASHAEGFITQTAKLAAHSEGNQTYAGGVASHSEGTYTYALGESSHSEGWADSEMDSSLISKTKDDIYKDWYDKLRTNDRTNMFSTAFGKASHVEGITNIALGDSSHVEGDYNVAYGGSAHAEGYRTKAFGDCSHVEGGKVTSAPEPRAYEYGDHVEGASCTSLNGGYNHVEGLSILVSGNASHGEGRGLSYSQDLHDIISVDSSSKSFILNGDYTSEDVSKYISGVVKGIIPNAAIIINDKMYTVDTVENISGNTKVTLKEDIDFTLDDITYFAIYNKGYCVGECNHLEGGGNILIGRYSHIEGISNFLETGEALHIEGLSNISSSGRCSHIEGASNKNSGDLLHIEGYKNTVTGAKNHVEGQAHVVEGLVNHVEGNQHIVKSNVCHVEGQKNIVNNNMEHAQGNFNKSNTGDTTDKKTRHSIGIGTSEDDRKNALEVMENGDHYIVGIGGYDGTNPDTAQTLQEVVNSKQDELVSGTNVKTINGESILGTGNITIGNTGSFINIITKNTADKVIDSFHSETWNINIDDSYANTATYLSLILNCTYNATVDIKVTTTKPFYFEISIIRKYNDSKLMHTINITYPTSIYIWDLSNPVEPNAQESTSSYSADFNNQNRVILKNDLALLLL